MKITSARSWVVKVPWDDNPGADEPRDLTERTFVFIQVDTDEGITGWGEGDLYVSDRPGLGINLDPEFLAAHEIDFNEELAGKHPDA